MYLTKALKTTGRKLAALSFEDLSAERVAAILNRLRRLPPSKRRQMLRAYCYAIKREARRYQAKVEYAGVFSEAASQALAKALSAHYKRPIAVEAQATPSLLAGIRVSIADDIYDFSVSGRLAAFLKPYETHKG